MTLWIRVDADTADNPKVGRFAAKLGLSVEAAVGHLVRVWGKMAEQNSDGKLAGVRGITIESWANWRGKKGRFADAFRRTFVVKGGIVKGYGERQGKLILKQIAHREYMRDWRGRDQPGKNGGESHGDTHVSVTERSRRVSRETHGERHVRPLTVTKSKPKDRSLRPGPRQGDPADISSVIARFTAKTGREVTP